MFADNFINVLPSFLKSVIFGLVLFKRTVTDEGMGPAWQRLSGASAGEGFLVLLKI